MGALASDLEREYWELLRSALQKIMKTIGDEIRRMTLPFEVRSVKADTDGQYAGEFTGYAAGIHNIDRVGDMILPGAFTDDLPRFMREGVVCWQHDWMTPIGVPLEAKEDSYGLMTRARVSKTAQGQDAMTLIRDGVVRKLSIGYRVQNYVWVDRSGLAAYLQVSGLPLERREAILRQYDEMELTECFLLKKIRLYEYSPVTVPANPNATIMDAKGLLAGLTFRDQLLTVLAAAKSIATQAETIKVMRAKQGRGLSEERREELRQLAYEMLNVSDAIREVLVEDEKAEQKIEAPLMIDAGKLFAQFQQIEARRLGCAV